MENNFLSKTKIPDKLPEDMQKIINEMKHLSSQEQCLRKAYEVLTKKYRGYRLRTYRQFFQIFSFNIQRLWDKNGFIHCHNANYLMRIMLVKSGFFENKNIENKWTLVNCTLHQYLQVRLENGQYTNIDIWGAVYGIKFGDYAHGFH